MTAVDRARRALRRAGLPRFTSAIVGLALELREAGHDRESARHAGVGMRALACMGALERIGFDATPAPAPAPAPRRRPPVARSPRRSEPPPAEPLELESNDLALYIDPRDAAICRLAKQYGQGFAAAVATLTDPRRPT